MTHLQKKTAKKDSLIQFRVNAKDKHTIQQAALLRGLDPSVYIRTLIVESAKQEVLSASEQTHLVLTAEEWERFVQIMNAPIATNHALKNAFKEFKKKYK